MKLAQFLDKAIGRDDHNFLGIAHHGSNNHHKKHLHWFTLMDTIEANVLQSKVFKSLFCLLHGNLLGQVVVHLANECDVFTHIEIGYEWRLGREFYHIAIVYQLRLNLIVMVDDF